MLGPQAGRLLAHVLMQGAHGDRPVTLIGYSMGARLEFHCLLELARCNCRGARHPHTPLVNKGLDAQLCI